MDLKLTEWMDEVDAVVVLLDAPPAVAAVVATPPPPTPEEEEEETFLILRIPLSLVQLIVLRSRIATLLALCTIPSFVPNGRSNTTSV